MMLAHGSNHLLFFLHLLMGQLHHAGQTCESDEPLKGRFNPFN